MNEIPGARERPGGTQIKILEHDGETSISAPPQGLGLPLIILGAIDTFGLGVFIVALVLFVLERHSFFGVRDLLPTDNTPTQHWKWFFVASWIGLIIGGGWVLLYILRLGYQSEELCFTHDCLIWYHRTIGDLRERRFPLSTISAFQLTHDPAGMRRSRLLLLTPVDEHGQPASEEEHVLFENTTEEEKDWLESVCNVLLIRYRNPTP
ncbi:MAG TPA: hypothetical protein VFW40_04930 [Capsulimonadaceae bacterium]|nr:hypothetical protein [Capsulimonadaceae bacterium]